MLIHICMQRFFNGVTISVLQLWIDRLILFNITCNTLYRYTQNINTKYIKYKDDTKCASSYFHCGPYAVITEYCIPGDFTWKSNTLFQNCQQQQCILPIV